MSPSTDEGLLTASEHRAMELTGQLWGELQAIVGRAKSRAADLNELVGHVHAIQNTILAQAAGRAYPDRYRLLGEVLEAAAPPKDDGFYWPFGGAVPGHLLLSVTVDGPPGSPPLFRCECGFEAPGGREAWIRHVRPKMIGAREAAEGRTSPSGE